MDEIKARVEDLTHEGMGVVKALERVYFVDGVLPGELVRMRPGRKRRRKFEGVALEVLQPSAHRVAPRCEYFGICGGCALQHVKAMAQRRYKEKILLDQLARIGRVTPGELTPALHGESWGYRRKARLGVKFVPKKGGILVGFRERNSPFITSLQWCRTLHPPNFRTAARAPSENTHKPGRSIFTPSPAARTA